MLNPKKINRRLAVANVVSCLIVYPFLDGYPVLQGCVAVAGFVSAFIGGIEFLTSDEFTSPRPRGHEEDAD